MYFPTAKALLDTTEAPLLSQIKNIVTRCLPGNLLVSFLTSRIESETVGSMIDLVTVMYRRGYERLPVTKLLNRLSELGDVSAEFIGRGTGLNRGITFTIIAPDGQAAAVGWLLD